jgi:predicted esterase
MTLHEGQPVLRGGTAITNARAAMILIHGRGATAEDIYALGEEVAADLSGVALLAPQAAGNAWYPQRFLAPLAQNEPYLTSALGVMGRLIAELNQAGLGTANIALVGFSQGACLSLEFAARHAQRYGAVVGLSGAVIGPPGHPRDLEGSLAGTPVYLGCSDRDGHIPVGSVEETAGVMERLGGKVAKNIFPGMGHTINAEEVAAVRDLMRALSEGV